MLSHRRTDHHQFQVTGDDQDGSALSCQQLLVGQIQLRATNLLKGGQHVMYKHLYYRELSIHLEIASQLHDTKMTQHSLRFNIN